MSRKISLPPNPRVGSRPYRPSVGSAAAAKIPISRATILRNNMMIVGAKNNERNLSLSTGRVPRRSTLQSLRRSLANEDMGAHRSNLPRACGFLLHGESFSGSTGCDFNPRASRIIGYHEDTARSNGSAIPLGAPKTISRPLSGSFRGFQRPIERSRKPEDCEGCTCIDGDCWDEAELSKHYDQSPPKQVRSTEAGGRVSVKRNVSVQDTNHRLSESVSVQVRAESVDRSSQTDDEENRNPHHLRNVISLGRQSTSGQFAVKKRRSQSYPEHFPSDKNMDGRNAKRYGSSESDLEGTPSKVITNSIKRRKGSFTNPGSEQLPEVHGLGPPSTREHAAVLTQPKGTDRRQLERPGEETDSVPDNRDTIERSRDYIRRLISEVEQQQKDEMDESEEGGDLDDAELRRPKRSLDQGQALHHHQKHSDQSGKPQIEHEPAEQKTKRSRPIRLGERDRMVDVGDRYPSRREGQAKSKKSIGDRSDKSDTSSSDRGGTTRTKSRGNKNSASWNKRKSQRNGDEELKDTREYFDPVKNAVIKVGKRIVRESKGNDGDDPNVEVSSENSLEEPRDRRDEADRLRGNSRRHNHSEANRSVDLMTSPRSGMSLKRDPNGRNGPVGRRSHRERFERSKEDLDQRPSYHSRQDPSATLLSEHSDGRKRRERRISGDEDNYVVEERNEKGLRGRKGLVGRSRVGRPHTKPDDYRREVARRRNDSSNRGSAEGIVVEQDRRKTGASSRSRNVPDRVPPKRDAARSGKRLRGTESEDPVYSETSVMEPDRKRASVSHGRQAQSNLARLELSDERQDRVRARNPMNVDQESAENFDDDLKRRKTRTSRRLRSGLGPKAQRDDKPYKEGAQDRVNHTQSTTRETESRKRTGSLVGLRMAEVRSRPNDRQDFRERRTGSIHQARIDEEKAHRDRRTSGGSRDKSGSLRAPRDDITKNGVQSRRSIGRTDPSNFVNRKRSDSSLKSRAGRPDSEPTGRLDTREHSRQTIAPRYEAEVSGELDRRRTSTPGGSRNRPNLERQRHSRVPTLDRDRNFEEGYTVDDDAGNDTVPTGRTGSTRDSLESRSRRPRSQANEDHRTASIDRAHTEETPDEPNRNRTNISRDGAAPGFQRDDIKKSEVRGGTSIDRNDPSRVEDGERSASSAQFRTTRPRSVPKEPFDARDHRTRIVDQEIAEEVPSELDRRRTRTSDGSRDRSNHNINDRRDKASARNTDINNDNYGYAANDDVRDGTVPTGRIELGRDDRPTRPRSRVNDHGTYRERQSENLDRGHPEKSVDDLDRRRMRVSAGSRSTFGQVAQMDTRLPTRRVESPSTKYAAEPTKRTKSPDDARASGSRSRRNDHRRSDSADRASADGVETEERHPRRDKSDDRGYEQEVADEEPRSRRRTDSPVDSRRISNHRTPMRTHSDKTENEEDENLERRRITNKKDSGKQKPEVDMTVNRGGERLLDRPRPNRDEPSEQDRVRSQAERRTPKKATDDYDETDESKDHVTPRRRTGKSAKLDEKETMRAHRGRGERKLEVDSVDELDAKRASNEREPAQLIRQREATVEGPRTSREGRLKDTDDTKSRQHSTRNNGRKIVEKRSNGENVEERKTIGSSDNDPEHRWRQLPADPHFDEEAALLKIHEFKEKNQHVYAARKSRKRDDDNQRNAPDEDLNEQAAALAESGAGRPRSTKETPKAELSKSGPGVSEERERSKNPSHEKRATQRDGRAMEYREEFPQTDLPERPSHNWLLGNEKAGVFDKDYDIDFTSENGGRRSRGQKDERPAQQGTRRTLSDSPPLPNDEISTRSDKADSGERNPGEPRNERPNNSRLLRSHVDDDEANVKSQDYRGRDSRKFNADRIHRNASEDSLDELGRSEGESLNHRGDKVSRLQVHSSSHPQRGTQNEHGYRERSESAERRRSYSGKSNRPSDEELEDETDELEPAGPTTTKQRGNAQRSNNDDRPRQEKERPKTLDEDQDGSVPSKPRPRQRPSRHAVRQAGGRTDSSDDHNDIDEAGSLREDSLDRPDKPDKDGSIVEERRGERTRMGEHSLSPSGSPSKKLKSGPAGAKKLTPRTSLPRARLSVDSQGSGLSDITTDSVRSMSKEVRRGAHQSKESRHRAVRSDQESRKGRSEKVKDRGKGTRGEGRALREAKSENYSSASSHSSKSSTESHASARSRTGALQKKDKKAKAAIEERDYSTHSLSHMHGKDYKSPSRTEGETRTAAEKMRRRKSGTGYKHSKSSPRPRDRAEQHVNKEASNTNMNSEVLHPESSRSLSEVLSSDHSVDSVKSARKRTLKARSSEKGRSIKHSQKIKDRRDLEMLNDSPRLASVTSDQSSNEGPSSARRSRKSEKDKRASSKAARTSKREVQAQRVRPEEFDRSIKLSETSEKKSDEIWDVDLEKARDLNAVDMLLQSRRSGGTKDGPKSDAELVKEISERMSSIRFKKDEMEPMKKDSFNILKSEEKLWNATKVSLNSSSVSEKRDHVGAAESFAKTKTRVAGHATSDEKLKREGVESFAEKRPEVSRKVLGEDRDRVVDTYSKHHYRRREGEEEDEHDHNHHSAKTRWSSNEEVPQVSKRSRDEPMRQDGVSDSERTPGRNMYGNSPSNQHVRDSGKPAFDHRNHQEERVQEPRMENSNAAGHLRDKDSMRTRQPPLRGVEQNLSASPLVDCCDSCDVMDLAHRGTPVSGFSKLNDRNQLVDEETVKHGSQAFRGPADRRDPVVTGLGGAKLMVLDQRTVQKQVVEEESTCEMVSGVYSEELCECEESAEVLHDTRPVVGSSNRERQEFISRDGKRVIFIPASNTRETREEFTNGKDQLKAERTPAVNSEMSVIMQRLDILTAPKVTHDQNEQTAQAEIVRPVRHQSEQTVQESSPRKVSRDMGEQTPKHATREEGEQTLLPRKMSRDQGEQTVKPLTREEADQTSGRKSKEVGEQTTRRMSKDEAEQTMQVVNMILQQRSSPRREEPKGQDTPYESSSEMFEPVTGQMKPKNETKNAETTSPVQERPLPTVESQSQTDHATYKEEDTHSEKQRGRNPLEDETELEPSSSSSDSTLSDGEYVTNPRMTGILLSQLDMMRKKRKARRKRGLKNANHEVVTSAEDTEEADEDTEDEEVGVVPHRRRSEGQVVTLEYESVTEFLDASAFSPTQHTQTSTFIPAIHPSESQYSEYSNVDVHRSESSGIVDHHHSDENEEDDVEIDVSLSQGSENGQLPYLHVAREDIVKLPDALNGYKRSS